MEQNAPSHLRKDRLHPAIWLIWGVTLIFTLFQFILQLSCGVMLKQMMHSFQLNATEAGLLSGAYFYIYVILQTPAGLLMDCFGTRHLLSWGSLLCGIGCILLASSSSFSVAFVARMMMGAGGSFAFVGSMHSLREWFPSHYFSLLLGFAETGGMLFSLMGSVTLAYYVSHAGWRVSTHYLGYIAIIISAACFAIVRDRHSEASDLPQQHTVLGFRERLQLILRNKTLLFNGMYCGILFTVVSVLGALWGIPFVQSTLHVSLTSATAICSMTFIGAGIGCPVWAAISNATGQYRALFLVSSLLTAALLMLTLYSPIHSKVLFANAFFLLGFLCSSYVLSFTLVNEHADSRAKSTGIGFTNSFCMLTAPVFQTLIGALISYSSHHHARNTHIAYLSSDYRFALTVLPILLVGAAILALSLPDKKRR